MNTGGRADGIAWFVFLFSRTVWAMFLTTTCFVHHRKVLADLRAGGRAAAGRALPAAPHRRRRARAGYGCSRRCSGSFGVGDGVPRRRSRRRGPDSRSAFFPPGTLILFRLTRAIKLTSCLFIHRFVNKSTKISPGPSPGTRSWTASDATLCAGYSWRTRGTIPRWGTAR